MSFSTVSIRYIGLFRFTKSNYIRKSLKFHTSASRFSDEASNTEKTKNEKNAENNYYDIIVSGGGMVGTAMASVFGRDELFKNLKIGLIESTNEKQPYEMPLMHSNRVSALSKASVDLLKYLDCFDFIENTRYCQVKQMQVWDACSDSVINFKSDDFNELAIIVENDVIQEALNRTLKAYKNIDVFYSSKITDITNESDQFITVKIGNNTVNTKLLIGSDGHNSFVRKKANIDVTEIDYEQLAIVATLKLSQRENYTAWQRFLPTGPLALLPLNDEYSSLVWSIKKSAAKELLKLNDDEFINRLNHAFVDESYKNNFATNIDKIIDNAVDFISSNTKQENLFSDKIRQIPPKIEACVANTRASFPLGFCHANNYISNRIALIGDAAHRIHPLAGQGVNLGFGDVNCLANKLRENLKNGSELGSRLYLEEYESSRLKDAYPKILFIHFLNSLYTTDKFQNTFIQTPIVALRSVGLTLSNRLKFIKSYFLRGATE